MIDPEQHNPSSMVGRTIAGRYKIRATIGSGGMGFVYRATQFPIEREVALKVLRADLAHQEGIAERFTREARAASRIKHPNAIVIYEFGESEGTFYLAMELLYGETLRQRLRREPPLTSEQALDVFEAMAGALGAAHRVGVVHRDLKPDNIFLSQVEGLGEVVKVLDFGLAKLLDRGPAEESLQTDINLRLGTPRYMAPEQAMGLRPIDARCDVYALGLLLFEMLARRAPFLGEDGMEVLAQRLRKDAPRLSQVIPEGRFGEGIEGLLASMLLRDREHRPSDANEVLQRVRELRRSGQVYVDFVEEEGAPTIMGQPAPLLPPVPVQQQVISQPVQQYQQQWGRRGAGSGGQHEPLVSREVPAAQMPLQRDLDDFDKPTVVLSSGRGPGERLEDMTALAAATYVQPRRPRQGDERSQPDRDARSPVVIDRPAQMALAPGFPQLTKRVVIFLLLVAAGAPLLALLLRWYLNRSEHVEVPPQQDRGAAAPPGQDGILAGSAVPAVESLDGSAPAADAAGRAVVETAKPVQRADRRRRQPRASASLRTAPVDRVKP